MIDIIIPTFNSNEYIYQAINSCLKQSHSDVKITVVDDCSTKILSGLKEKYPTINFLKTNKNGGPGAARNFGIKNTSQEYISFLDDDDIMSLDKIKLTLDNFSKDVDMICGNYQRIINGMLYPQFYSKNVNVNYNNLMKVNLVATGSVTIRRTLIDKVGYFNEKYRICEDYDFWLRISEVSSIKYLPETLYYYRVNRGGNSLTQSTNAKEVENANIKEIRESSIKRMSGV
jgi:glycosyltransferase involved in cell wall biosynthesis